MVKEKKPKPCVHEEQLKNLEQYIYNAELTPHLHSEDYLEGLKMAYFIQNQKEYDNGIKEGREASGTVGDACPKTGSNDPAEQATSSPQAVKEDKK